MTATKSHSRTRTTAATRPDFAEILAKEGIEAVNKALAAATATDERTKRSLRQKAAKAARRSTKPTSKKKRQPAKPIALSPKAIAAALVQAWADGDRSPYQFQAFLAEAVTEGLSVADLHKAAKDWRPKPYVEPPRRLVDLIDGHVGGHFANIADAMIKDDPNCTLGTFYDNMENDVGELAGIVDDWGTDVKLTALVDDLEAAA